MAVPIDALPGGVVLVGGTGCAGAGLGDGDAIGVSAPMLVELDVAASLDVDGIVVGADGDDVVDSLDVDDGFDPLDVVEVDDPFDVDELVEVLGVEEVVVVPWVGPVDASALAVGGEEVGSAVGVVGVAPVSAIATPADPVVTPAIATPAPTATRYRRDLLRATRPVWLSTGLDAALESRCGDGSATGIRGGALNVNTARGFSTISSGSSKLTTQRRPLSDGSSILEASARCAVRTVALLTTSLGGARGPRSPSTSARRRREARPFRTGA